MPVDISIYNQLLQKPKTVAEYDAEAMQNQQNRLALQTGQMRMDEYTRSVSDGNKLRQVVSGFGTDKGANYNALLGAGRLDEAQKYEKSNADIAKSAADAKHTEAQAVETHIKAVNLKMGQVRDMFNTIQTPDQAALLIKGMYADPDLGKLFAMKGDTVEAAISRIPTDPVKFTEWVQAASLNAEKLASYRTPDANAVLTAQTSTDNSKRSDATARRGQDITAGSAAAGRLQAERHFNGGKVPSGYRAGPDGTLAFIPGGPADPAAGGGKAPTEFQGKSAAFGARAQEADRIISGLAGKFSPARVNSKQLVEKTWLIGGALGAGVNATMSDSDQKAEQAQRDFINAVLRQESGAAIGEGEFDNARKQYFPQPGDAAGVIAQKARNRKLAVQGLHNNAGKAAFSAPPAEDIHAQADAILAGGKK